MFNVRCILYRTRIRHDNIQSGAAKAIPILGQFDKDSRARI